MIPHRLPPQQLTIYMSGLPPHLCCEGIVRKILKYTCTIHEIRLISANLTYVVDAYGSDAYVPDTAHIAMQTTQPNNSAFNIWPLQFEVITEDMISYPYEPIDPTRTEDIPGDSQLDTEDRAEMLQYYYELQDGIDEATSRRQDVSTDWDLTHLKQIILWRSKKWQTSHDQLADPIVLSFSYYP